MRRLSPLPSAAAKADPVKLMRRLQDLAGQRKNTETVRRNLVLARAAQLRREVRETGPAIIEEIQS